MKSKWLRVLLAVLVLWAGVSISLAESTAPVLAAGL